ncbi:hypothetical protein DPMN_069713 [Dreissena polymorpha]|uniref:Uncharacterized protein n=1 Tax=Dreissena polymorpha TaxID=45954 RepID=A0A9D3Z450_DREPO|nr:hypothetical protein DPMN_069713 [Dreissena polymorpha]
MLTGLCYSVTCPIGYTANGNICYHYHKTCYTWDRASEACPTAGGFLYKIADDESYQLIYSIVDGNGGAL